MPGDSEVGNDGSGCTSRRRHLDEDVGGFDIAVEDAEGVDAGKGSEDVDNDRVRNRVGRVCEIVLERCGDKGEDEMEVGIAREGQCIEELDDIWVVD